MDIGKGFGACPANGSRYCVGDDDTHTPDILPQTMCEHRLLTCLRPGDSRAGCRRDLCFLPDRPSHWQLAKLGPAALGSVDQSFPLSLEMIKLGTMVARVSASEVSALPALLASHCVTVMTLALMSCPIISCAQSVDRWQRRQRRCSSSWSAPPTRASSTSSARTPASSLRSCSSSSTILE